MSNTRLKELGKRLLISIPFFALGIFMFRAGGLISLFAIFYFVIPAFILAGPLASMACEPLRGIFFPRGRRIKYLPFSIPEAMIQDGEYGKAMQAYGELLARAPQNHRIYLMMLKLAIIDMKDPKAARDIFSRAMKDLADQRKRDLVSEEYKLMRSSISDAGSNET